MNLSKVAKRAFLSITAAFALVLCLTLGAGTAHAAVVVDKTISAAGGSITFSYTTQASITNLSSKPAWLSVSSRMNSASSVTYTITASANPNCNSRSFDLCFSGTNETYRITQYGLGHNYSVYEKTNPTCTSYGHECFKCSRCESRTQGNQLPMVAHNSNGYQKQVATYTADGFERTYCTVCKKEMSRTKLPRLKVHVVFDPQNGSSSTSKDQYASDKITGFPSVSRTGYTLKGWYTKTSGGTQYTSSSTVPAQSTLTLYAQWSAKIIVVTLDANGGNKVDPNQNGILFGNKYGTMPTPTRTGYTFDGWYTAKSGGSKVTSTTVITNGSNHTLYAHWTANKYTVYFNNGMTTTKGTVTYGNTYGALSKPTKTGYTLVGWYTSASGGSQVTPDTKVTITADQTLYAHWKANNYTVYFDSQGGSTVSSRTVTFDSTYGTSKNQLTNPTRDGYKFEGWFTEKSGGTKIAYTSKMTTAKNHTLYAQWTANKYTVTFDSVGGSSVTSVSVTYNGKYGNLPTPTRNDGDYQFLGWYSGANGGSVVTKDTQVSTASNHKLYAHWLKRLPAYNGHAGDYTFVANDFGEDWSYYFISTDNKYSTAKVSRPNWIKETSCNKTTRVVTIPCKENVNPSNRYTLIYAYAKGSAKAIVYKIVQNVPYYTVTYDVNGDGATATIRSRMIAYGSTYGKVDDPKRKGYTFTGWYTEANGGSQVTETTIMSTASDHKVYAHWMSDFFVANPRFKETNTLEEPYCSGIEATKQIGYNEYMDIYTRRSGKYNVLMLSDEDYMSDILYRAGELSVLVGGVSIITKNASEMYFRYLYGNGEKMYYDAAYMVLDSIEGRDAYTKDVTNLVNQLEAHLQPGQTITFTDVDASANPITFNGGFQRLGDNNAWAGVKCGSTGVSASCSYDGTTYTMDLKYYIKDYYDFYYEDKDNNSQADVELLLLHLDELAYLVPFGYASPFETCGVYHTTITWKTGENPSSINLFGMGVFAYVNGESLYDENANAYGAGGGHGY